MIKIRGGATKHAGWARFPSAGEGVGLVSRLPFLGGASPQNLDSVGFGVGGASRAAVCRTRFASRCAESALGAGRFCGGGGGGGGAFCALLGCAAVLISHASRPERLREGLPPFAQDRGPAWDDLRLALGCLSSAAIKGNLMEAMSPQQDHIGQGRSSSLTGGNRRSAASEGKKVRAPTPRSPVQNRRPGGMESRLPP